MRTAVLFALVTLFAGCVARPVSTGPAYCDPTTDAWLMTAGPDTQPSTIAAGNTTRLQVFLYECGGMPLVVDRTSGGGGNCVFDFLVAYVVQGNHTWDLTRDATGAARARPPFPPPCPPVTEPNTTLPPHGNLSAFFGWNGTLASTACVTTANGTRCDSDASFEPAPVGTYEIVARARVNGHELETWANITVVRSGFHLLGADFNWTYATPLDVKSVRTALTDMGFTVETPCGRQDCDTGRTRNSCSDFVTCAEIGYGARLRDGAPAVDVWLPNDGRRTSATTPRQHIARRTRFAATWPRMRRPPSRTSTLA